MDDLGVYVTLAPNGRLSGEVVVVRKGFQAEGEKITFTAGDTAKPVLAKVRGGIVETTVEQEIITFSELIFYYYAVIVDHLTIVADFMLREYGDGRTPVDRNIYEYMMDMTHDLIDTLTEEDPVHGTLLRTAVHDALPEDDGTNACMLKTATALIPILQEIVFLQGLTLQVLDDLRNGVPLDFEGKYSELRRTEVTQSIVMGSDMTTRYRFRFPDAYYRFLLLNFISHKPRVALCQNCGRFFIPKTEKKTLYCDREIRDGKTCKDYGPRRKHKQEAAMDRVIEEFDRARQRMYKRYERARYYNQKPSDRDLTAAGLYDWIAAATEARNKYLAGELTEDEALKIINAT